MFRRKKKIFIRRDEHVHPEGFVRATEVEAERNPNHLEDIPPTSNYFKTFEIKKSRLPSGLAWGILGIIVLFVGGFIVSFYFARGKIIDSLALQADKLQAGVSDLQNLDPQSAAHDFASANISAPDWAGTLGVLGSLFKQSSDAIKAFSDLSNELSAFSSNLLSLQNDTFGFFVTGDGVKFLSDLKTMQSILRAADADGSVLASTAGGMGGSLPVDGSVYLSFKAEMQGAESFLNTFIPWLEDGNSHHILVIFQNPSELRPAGGFLGSYADVTIASGTIENIDVHDVADVDRAFTANIIPPQPLQLEGPRFRPADTNWFFDFPTSASETIRYFESSTLYSSTSFEGVVAISPKILQDLLTVTGSVSTTNGSFNAGNLLPAIQKIVQNGQATQATYPKKVLGDLTLAITQKLASSTDEQKQAIFSMALDWIAKKDIMAYFENHVFENFALNYGAGGDMYELPQDFNGDYLAIVNTNINGDKSDLYISQNVTFDTEINADGTATDHLTIVRKDAAPKTADWWYRTTNQDYLQLFLPPGSALENEDGGLMKKISPPVDYLTKKYATDTLVAAIDAATETSFSYPAVMTHPESGKQVFATWTGVRAGTSTQISFDYLHRLFRIPAPGVKYEFVFEKQAGAQGNYKFSINAPLGYVFAENGLASYDYESNDPPGRVVIDLTLAKLQ